MALALGLATSPDLPFQKWQPAVGGVVAGLTALFVVALLDRRAPPVATRCGVPSRYPATATARRGETRTRRCASVSASTIVPSVSIASSTTASPSGWKPRARPPAPSSSKVRVPCPWARVIVPRSPRTES